MFLPSSFDLHWIFDLIRFTRWLLETCFLRKTSIFRPWWIYSSYGSYFIYSLDIWKYRVLIFELLAGLIFFFSLKIIKHDTDFKYKKYSTKSYTRCRSARDIRRLQISLKWVKLSCLRITWKYNRAKNSRG